jgi:hypothetical protein
MQLSSYSPTEEEFESFYKNSKKESIRELFYISKTLLNVFEKLGDNDNDTIMKLVDTMMADERLVTINTELNKISGSVCVIDKYGRFEFSFYNPQGRDYTVSISLDLIKNFDFRVIEKTSDRCALQLINTSTIDNLPLDCSSFNVEATVTITLKEDYGD